MAFSRSLSLAQSSVLSDSTGRPSWRLAAWKARAGSSAEQGVRLRRAEEIETLSYRTVVPVLVPRERLVPADNPA